MDTASADPHLHVCNDARHKPSILREITEQRYKDVADTKDKVSAAELRQQIAEVDKVLGGPLSLVDCVRAAPGSIALAAEFKRASPSKGDIAPHLVASEQGVIYAKAGAAVLSVLTEPRWFKGTPQDMYDVRLATQSLTPRPAILRKDFIVDDYQILEARAHGADTILLIVAILEVERLQNLVRSSREWGMEPLVEVNSLEEMEIALDVGAKVIGVNNRNLHTFKVDLRTTEKVMEAARRRGISWDRQRGDIMIAALSGISSRAEVVRYEKAGVAAVLIGETLMKAAIPGRAVRELLGLDIPVQGRCSSDVLIKVCGLTRVDDALAAAQAGVNLIGTIFCKSPRQVNAAQSREIVHAIRKFGERTDRVLSPHNYAALFPSPSYYESWRSELLRVTRKTPLVVGVFQDTPMEQLMEIVQASGVDMVQLHGNETLEYAREVTSRTGVPCAMVLHVPHEGAEAGEILRRLEGEASIAGGPIALMLDTSVHGQAGGTGKQFDWKLARACREREYPVIVAGGLSPETAREVLRIAEPAGLDVSSGVETSPGHKDVSRVRHFVTEVRAS